MTDKPDEPRRAYELELKVGADTLDDLIGFLRNFETHLYMGMITRGATGGPTSGATYDLRVDETITHDAWAEANQRYVDWMRDRDAAKAATPEPQ